MLVEPYRTTATPSLIDGARSGRVDVNDGREQRLVLRTAVAGSDEPSRVEFIRHKDELEALPKRLQANVRLKVGPKLLLAVGAHAPFRRHERARLARRHDRNIDLLFLLGPRWRVEAWH